MPPTSLHARSRGFLLLVTLALLAFFTAPARSDVSLSKPVSGKSFSASSGAASVEIVWIESNAKPKLSDITSYTFVLCSGPNDDIDAVETLDEAVSADDIDGYSYTASIDASVGASGYYYIQVYAKAKTGWTIHYTNRFKLTDMTGSYEPSGDADDEAPSGQTSLSDGTQTGATSINSASFSVYYTSQTGKTRYAPMQTQPGSTVTHNKQSWSRRYPTSAVTYYKSVINSLQQQSTITPGWSYTVSSAVNWASPAPMPSVNGWYAASEKLTRTPTLYTPAILATARTKTASDSTST